MSNPNAQFYSLGAEHERTIRVAYPVRQGRIVLRTELNWDRVVEADAVSEDRTLWTFTLRSRRPFLYFKPQLVDAAGARWAGGANLLAVMTEDSGRSVFPYFETEAKGSFHPAFEVESAVLGHELGVRVYLPPGYGENPLKRYPVLYMQDGKNLFFPEEAFLGQEWSVDETLALLDEMSAVERIVVVGLHTTKREKDYTKPGYAKYGRAVTRDVMARIEREFRVLKGNEYTGVMGSSLGGVVSFYLAWAYPERFGFAACLSSTFSHRDDLIDRVLIEPKRAVRFYLDSGWPGDNYEVTLAMALALVRRGYRYGRDLMHFAFPNAKHSEQSWGDRLHLPLQMFTGTVTMSAFERIPQEK